ncbi:DUF4359 domain-containing protein [Roseofilum sp. BLCC_M91]|uniref:DUF4359 domain-containing protein n=1 Tax=Roseofilum halophilum BLCC-M91 TaxID=3022259 RepID=A0ABT7BG74_9CYAN|nr:DUF4359 domain-containing protein [Roseofilum halophilum]MDJ1177589.1 DUF4359 domain-containing protein [Roseofilum halophilum BLCC-M91]
MKALKMVALVGGVAIATLTGAMVATNPKSPNYEEFASQQLVEYLQENVCDKTNQTLGNILQQSCDNFLQEARPQLQTIIAQRTERQNYILFSIYRTNLSVAAFLPAYEFETLGVFSNFHILKAEETSAP